MNKSKKTNVLQVLGGLYCGGTETFVMNMFRSIDKEKFQFDFLIHEKDHGHYDQEVTKLGGRIYRIPDRTEVGTYKYFINLFKILLEIKPDVVHSHGMFNSGAVMFASFLVGVKKRISHSHNTEDQAKNNFPRKYFRLVMRLLILIFSTKQLACSRDAATYLFGSENLKKGKSEVMNNAVNSNEFKFDKAIRTEIRNELEIEDKLVIGHIGRFTKQKNHDFLTDVYKRLHDIYPNSVLIMMGEGNLRPIIEEKMNYYGLSQKVKFLGVRNDIPRILQGVDLFLLPSLYEGFPVVLVEAQAAGVRCIVSDIITTDCDVTGNMEFLSIKDENLWVERILASTYYHKDTSDVIRNKGYDIDTNAKRLSDIYLEGA